MCPVLSFLGPLGWCNKEPYDHRESLLSSVHCHSHELALKSTDAVIKMADGAIMQELNIILMKDIEMKQVGRNMNDPQSKDEE